MSNEGEFGHLLHRLRRERDLTQEALGQTCFCSRDTVKKLEAGQRRPSRQLAAQLADALGLAGQERAAFLTTARASQPLAEAVEPPPRDTPVPPPPRPTGTITFLFTDIEGSTRLWEQRRAAMQKAFPRQEALLRDALAAHGGYVYKMIGDAFQVAFSNAPAALTAALEAQRRLAAGEWGELGPLRVRMALDSGMVEERADDYVGPLLNRLGRLLSAAYGGQILLSSAAAELARTNLPPSATLTLLGSYQLKDFLQPETIYQANAPDLPAAFPPPRGATPAHTASRRTLPTAATPFVGRSQELGQLVALLVEPEVRLVTVVAPGGMGKTRLALAALERLQADERFHHGVAFAALAPLATAEHLDTALAAALGLPLTTGGPAARTPHQQLLDYLREKRLLLALDNCEHLLDGVAELVGAILAEAPGVTLMATSRERLELRAERLLPLDGMLTEKDGVALFAATARAVQPSFALDTGSRPLVAAICLKVGGMPLAIELAAGWTGTLSLEEIVAELEQGDELLSTGARDVPERQRSIRTVCDTTWGRLTSQERAVFAQVAVFRGGGTRRALQAVTGASLGQLQALVGKALLRYDPTRERYSVHELLRQYAGERLAEEPGAAEAARERHAAYYLAALAEREAALKGSGQVQALDEIGKDIENVRAAWEWAARNGRADLLMSAAACLGRFFEWQGRIDEGAAAFIQTQGALAQEGDPAAMHARVQSLAWLAAFQRLLGQPETARDTLDDVDTLLAWIAEQDVSSAALGAFVALQRGHLGLANNGDFQALHTAYTRSLQAARTAGDQWMEAQALYGLGNAYQHLTSDYAEAAACYEASLALQRRCGDQLGLSKTLADLSLNLRYRGQVFEGLLPAQESYELACQIDNPMQRAYSASNLGYANYWVGRTDRAIPLLEEAVRIVTDLGGLDLRANTLVRLGSAYSADGRYEQAFELAETGLEISRRIGYTVNEHMALTVLARTALGAGDYGRERRYRAEALAVMTERGAHFFLVQILCSGATVERKSGERALSRRLFLAALDLSLSQRIWVGLVEALWELAFMLAEEGAAERAIELISLVQRERPWPLSRIERDIFGQELDALLVSLPPDRVATARERGRGRDLWATGQELLDELEAAGWGRDGM